MSSRLKPAAILLFFAITAVWSAIKLQAHVPLICNVLASAAAFALVTAFSVRPEPARFHFRLKIALALSALCIGTFLAWNAALAPALVALQYEPPSVSSAELALSAFLAALLAFAWLRMMVPIIDTIRDRITDRSPLARQPLDDIRSTTEQLQQRFGTTRQHVGGVLHLGRDEKGRSVQLALGNRYCLVVGPTGTGKGVFLQRAATSTCRTEFVCIMDPKGDEWAPSALEVAAKAAGKPYAFVDLRLRAPAQFSLFAASDAIEVGEALIGGFSLQEKGRDSDFYGIADRRAARATADLLCRSSSRTPAEVLPKVRELFSKEAPKFVGYFEELAALPSVNGRAGLILPDFVQRGGALYIVGSTRDPTVIRAMRILTILFIQIAEKLKREKIRQRITLILDELKYHISRPTISAIGTVRSEGVRLVAAIQSLSDLQDVPDDVTAEAFRGAVLDNFEVQLFYRSADPDTADYASRRAGTSLVDQETRTLTRNAGLAEAVQTQRTLRSIQAPFIDPNTLKCLPNGVAVVIDPPQLARLVYIPTLPITRSATATKVRPVPAETISDVL